MLPHLIQRHSGNKSCHSFVDDGLQPRSPAADNLVSQQMTLSGRCATGLLADLQPSRAAPAATCPANAVTKVLRPVIGDISANCPLSAALRGDVMSAAVV